MSKLEEFKLQLADVDRKIAEYEELREDILFRIDAEQGN
jgi:hypothetical protein